MLGVRLRLGTAWFKVRRIGAGRCETGGVKPRILDTGYGLS